MRVVQHKTPQKEEKAPPAKPTEEEVYRVSVCHMCIVKSGLKKKHKNNYV